MNRSRGHAKIVARDAISVLTLAYACRSTTQENAAHQYQLARTLLRWLSLVICWLFAYIQWGTIQAALYQKQGLFVGVLIATITIPLISVVYYLVRVLSGCRRPRKVNSVLSFYATIQAPAWPQLSA